MPQPCRNAPPRLCSSSNKGRYHEKYHLLPSPPMPSYGDGTSLRVRAASLYRFSKRNASPTCRCTVTKASMLDANSSFLSVMSMGSNTLMPARPYQAQRDRNKNRPKNRKRNRLVSRLHMGLSRVSLIPIAFKRRRECRLKNTISRRNACSVC